MKKLIMVTVITACLALCAAVWPQTEVVGKTPTPAPTPAVIATEPPVGEPKTKVEVALQTTEKEKAEILKQEPCHEVISEPETAPTEPAVAPEPVLEPMPEAIPVSEITPAPESTPEPTPTAIDLQPGDMVYVPGFGWLESQGPNHVEYAEDMYENGNKIGIMG